MTLDEVEAVLGPPPIRHDDWGPGTVLLYTEVGLKVILDDAASLVEFIEIVDGSAVVEGVRLTGSASAVSDMLAKLGHVAQIELEDGWFSGSRYFPDLAIGLWTEDPDGDRIDTAAAWRRDAFQRRFGVEGET